MNTPRVVVLHHGEPRQKLMAWFLVDSGIPACVGASSDEAVALIAQHGAEAAVVNSTAPSREIAEIVKTLRLAAPACRIVVLQGERHREGDAPIAADACIHDVTDADALVAIVRDALGDGDWAMASVVERLRPSGG